MVEAAVDSTAASAFFQALSGCSNDAQVCLRTTAMIPRPASTKKPTGMRVSRYVPAAVSMKQRVGSLSRSCFDFWLKVYIISIDQISRAKKRNNLITRTTDHAGSKLRSSHGRDKSFRFSRPATPVGGDGNVDSKKDKPGPISQHSRVERKRQGYMEGT